MVVKKLPQCKHTAPMRCSDSPASFLCKQVCGGAMTCCSKTCKSPCFECQVLTRATINVQDAPIASTNVTSDTRIAHSKHPCERLLYCLHACGQDCHPKDDPCNPACKQKCRQECVHQSCQKPCSTPCPPCMEPCIWKCSHTACPVNCGSVCESVSPLTTCTHNN